MSQNILKKKPLVMIYIHDNDNYLGLIVKRALNFRYQFWIFSSTDLRYNITNTDRLDVNYFVMRTLCISNFFFFMKNVPCLIKSSSSESDQPALEGFKVAPSCFNLLFACLLLLDIVEQRGRST